MKFMDFIVIWYCPLPSKIHLSLQPPLFGTKPLTVEVQTLIEKGSQALPEVTQFLQQCD